MTAFVTLTAPDTGQFVDGTLIPMPADVAFASGQFNRRELTGPGRVSGALEFRRLSEEEAYDLATGK